MKRTLTAAAAVLVSGAGAVGLATTANAAETPQLPAELPTDNGLAQTAYHTAATLHSAQKTVGDVVPLEEQLTGRSADPVGDLAGGLTGGLPTGDLLGAVTGAAGGKSLDPSALGGLPVDQVGQVLPVGQTLPAGKSGTNDLLPPGVDSSLNQMQPSVPQTKPAPLPAQDVDLVGETVNGVVDSTPLGRTGDLLGAADGATGVVGDLTGGLPQTLPVGKATPAAQVLPPGVGDKVNDLASHGLLGGNTQLGG
ncbi:hypothetical protein [Saccharopolyspora hirsuta]|uniref:hypothetical protein n=1 Tax=Saccharopolyspora hirsuta TaxID=1837 RepID=UPI0018947C93|nr:hypothetical protein [Saccharopolyspora hirsuta]MBF6511002.1 hypothetical protein [Nocardia farcinica]